MKILIDTNILIPLEPTTTDLGAANIHLAALFQKMAFSGKHEVYYHPLAEYDFRRDKNQISNPPYGDSDSGCGRLRQRLE